MCILSYHPSNAPLNSDVYEALKNGFLNNPDGSGYAIASPNYDYVLTGHSLYGRDALDEFMDMRRDNPEGPALFHSRWATHGSISTANCHPFYVDHDKRTVLGHNGILPADAHPSKRDDRSDTRILADELLPITYSRLDHKPTRRRLATWAGRGNKLLILTVDPKYRRPYYLVNAAAGTWDRTTGMWHSNTGYMYVPTWHYPSTAAANTSDPYDPTTPYDSDFEVRYDAEGREICWMCGTGTLSEWTRYCNNTTCESCGDCGEWAGDCLCGMTGKTFSEKFRESYHRNESLFLND